MEKKKTVQGNIQKKQGNTSNNSNNKGNKDRDQPKKGVRKASDKMDMPGDTKNSEDDNWDQPEKRIEVDDDPGSTEKKIPRMH